VPAVERPQTAGDANKQAKTYDRIAGKRTLAYVK
jgi:hypothetical protein